MAFPVCHKTVFVLDQSSAFSQSCERLEIEIPKSTSIPAVPIDKSIWTSVTESVLEYCRIVYDIFPPSYVLDDVLTPTPLSQDRLIRLVVSGEQQEDPAIIPADGWGDQCTSSLATGLSKAGSPKAPSGQPAGHNLAPGIRKALEALTETTAMQRRAMTLKEERRQQSKIINRGRLCLLTYAENVQKSADSIVSAIQGEVAKVNSGLQASSSDRLLRLPISELELDIIYCFGDTPPAVEFPRGHGGIDQVMPISSTIKYSLSTVRGGQELSKRLLKLALRHFELASTTVTGIPMKEEQNSQSSANYDVELFHPAGAHAGLFNSDVYYGEEDRRRNKDEEVWLPSTPKEGCDYKTVTLKWCTPRSSATEIQNTLYCGRITPTDVNSRPSSCLTNFLLSGRSVMLEMPKRSGSKILSHMLTSHCGEIFIHTLNISRSPLEDPPSISEGLGGRVTDYRIADFGEIMKSNRLAPYLASPEDEDGEEQPLEKMGSRMTRFYQFCPLTISSTTIFNMEAVEPLQQIIVQEELTDENLAECRNIIYNLLNMEHKGDLLPVPLLPSTTGGKSKTLKKEDQYKMMFGELERFVASHCRTERHHQVLDTLMESRNRPQSERPPTAKPRKDDKPTEADVGNQKDRSQSNSYGEKALVDVRSSGFEKSHQSGSKRSRASGNPPGQNLFDLWTAKTQRDKKFNKNHPPFAGMRNIGEKAKLYLALERKDNNAHSAQSQQQSSMEMG